VDVVELVDVVVLDVDVDVDDVLVDCVGGGAIGTRSGGSAGSTNVVVVVSISVVDVDVDVLEDELDPTDGAVVDGDGMHVDAGPDDEVGSVVGGAAPAWEPNAPAIVATAMAATTMSGPRPPGSRRWTASTQTPAKIANAPMSSVAPKEPPELGRLHTWFIGVGGREGRT
jgi:hypothetical protein